TASRSRRACGWVRSAAARRFLQATQEIRVTHRFRFPSQRRLCVGTPEHKIADFDETGADSGHPYCDQAGSIRASIGERAESPLHAAQTRSSGPALDNKPTGAE